MSDATEPRYHWFGPETTAELCKQLTEAGPCRLEVRGHGRHMTLTVVPVAQAEDLTLTGRLFRPLNESHPCPPDC